MTKDYDIVEQELKQISQLSFEESGFGHDQQLALGKAVKIIEDKLDKLSIGQLRMVQDFLEKNKDRPQKGTLWKKLIMEVVDKVNVFMSETYDMKDDTVWADEGDKLVEELSFLKDRGKSKVQDCPDCVTDENKKKNK